MKTSHVLTRFGRFAIEDSGGAGTPVVLLHGGAANLRAWDGVVSLLCSTFRCVSIDLPGHGMTLVEPLKFESLSRALLELCEGLDIKRPVLGHSFGGLAAAAAAASYAGSFSGVMAIDPYLSDREVRRSHQTLTEACDEIRRMDWPWPDADDVDVEVARCVKTQYSPRADEDNLKAMVRRGYRAQADGRFVRFPRKEDEMKGVEANWSIDVTETFKSVPCPLSIVLAANHARRLEKRRRITNEIGSVLNEFDVFEFQCGHDIPGYLPKELADCIDAWVHKIAG